MHYFCTMNELASHIHKLLLESDIAIIPGFGGFIAHYIPAVRDAKNGLFIPPSRTIGFNDRLTLNDGLLLQSYMAMHHISSEEAETMLERDIEKLLNNLEDNGLVELAQLGTLYCDANNRYSFKTNEKTLSYPQLYGFKAFEMLEITQLQANKVAPIIPSKTYENSTKSFFQRKAYNLVGSMAIVAVTVASFFLFSTPVQNTGIESYQGNVQSANLFSITTTPINKPTQKTEEVNKNTIVYSHVTTDSKEVIAEQVTAPKEEKEEVVVASVKPSPTVPTQKIVENKPYHIIVASSIKENLALDLVSKLQKEGFADAQILKSQKRIRVSAASYNTKEEAYTSLNRITDQIEYASAWVYKAY